MKHSDGRPTYAASQLRLGAQPRWPTRKHMGCLQATREDKYYLRPPATALNDQADDLLHRLQPTIYQLTPPSSVFGKNRATGVYTLTTCHLEVPKMIPPSFIRHLNAGFIFYIDAWATARTRSGGAGMVVIEEYTANSRTLLDDIIPAPLPSLNSNGPTASSLQHIGGLHQDVSLAGRLSGCLHAARRRSFRLKTSL